MSTWGVRPFSPLFLRSPKHCKEREERSRADFPRVTLKPPATDSANFTVKLSLLGFETLCFVFPDCFIFVNHREEVGPDSKHQCEIGEKEVGVKQSPLSQREVPANPPTGLAHFTWQVEQFQFLRPCFQQELSHAFGFLRQIYTSVQSIMIEESSRRRKTQTESRKRITVCSGKAKSVSGLGSFQILTQSLSETTNRNTAENVWKVLNTGANGETS